MVNDNGNQFSNIPDNVPVKYIYIYIIRHFLFGLNNFNCMHP